MTMFSLGTKKLGSSLWTVVGRHVKPSYACHQRKPCSPHASFTQTRLPFPCHRELATIATNNNVISESDDKNAKIKINRTGAHGKFKQKLHNRVFTEDERAQDEQLKQSILSGSIEDDVFGTLQRRGRGKVGLKQSAPAFESGIEVESTVERKNTRSDVNIPRDGFTQTKSSSANTFAEKGRKARHSDNWGNTFGTLQEDELGGRIQESLSSAVGSHDERFSYDDEEEDGSHIRLSKYNRRRIPEWYGRRILKLGKRGEIRQAIEVFEDWMLKEDHVMPNSYVFTCIITVLGRAGYTQKAFSLFNKMKKMGIHPKPATYTALFNACANSPWKHDGRARAENLFHLMKEKQVGPTFITGKAMVKAFALCGDLGRAFALMDELSQVYRPDPEAFSFLLMACISDREAGLRHAIQVWRLMREMKVQPDLPLYNLLIRCVRDCGVGDVKSFQTLLAGGRVATEELVEEEMASAGFNSEPDHDRLSPRELELSPEKVQESAAAFGSTASSVSENSSANTRGWDSEDAAQATFAGTDPPQLLFNSDRQPSSLTVRDSPVTIPDVLSPASDTSSVVSLGDLSSKESRLALLGGVEGILSRMRKDRAEPDIITFSQLINVAMPTVEAEEQLLAVMKSFKVKPDIDLINALIHKRCMRKDFAAAKEARHLVGDHDLTANQRTYGVLAMTCKTQKDGAQLLKDMEAGEVGPNMEIVGTLMYAAGMNFHYRLWVLRQAQKLDLEPNSQFLKNIENNLNFARRSMLDAEKKGMQDSYFLSPFFHESVEKFVHHYEAWLKETRVPVPHHPWASFKPTEKEKKDAASA